jgi:hypothetical protein
MIDSLCDLIQKSLSFFSRAGARETPRPPPPGQTDWWNNICTTHRQVIEGQTLSLKALSPFKLLKQMPFFQCPWWMNLKLKAESTHSDWAGMNIIDSLSRHHQLELSSHSFLKGCTVLYKSQGGFELDFWIYLLRLGTKFTTYVRSTRQGISP